MFLSYKGLVKKLTARFQFVSKLFKKSVFIYNAIFKIALLKHGFVLVKTWLLTACGTGFYAVILFKNVWQN